MILYFFCHLIRIRKLKFKELVIISKVLAGRNLHILYEYVIDAFDGSKLFDTNEILRVEFIGSGKGLFSLNTYRKITNNNQEILFEKIFLKGSIDFKKSEHFYNYYFDDLTSKGLKIPERKKVVSGSKLIVVHFEFFNLIPIEVDHYFNAALSVCNVLNKNYIYTQVPKFLTDFPSNIFHNFREISYHDTLMKFLNFTNISNISYKLIFDSLKKLPKVTTHADLNKINIYKNNIVIDWDKFGIYPFGYDLGLVLCLNLKYTGHCRLEYILENEENYLEEENKLGILFYYLIFSFYFKIHLIHEKVFDKNLDKLKKIIIPIG